MPKIKPDEVDKELKKEQEDFGEPDESEEGVDVEKDLQRFIGNEPGNDTIAEEVEKDEKAIEEGAGMPGYPSGNNDEDASDE